MVRMFGRDPARVIALFPKAWPLIYRDLCTASFSPGPDGQPRIVFDDVADAVRRHPNYFVSWQGVCWGFSHIARVNGGDVRLSLADDLSRAEIWFSWN
jgi:hypothetical protein